MPKFQSAACFGTAVLLLTAIPTLAQTPSQPHHVHFIVQAPTTLAAPISGRLLVFLKAGTGDKAVDIDELNPGSTWVGAREVQSLSAGASVEIDPDAEDIAFPTPFASIAPASAL